METAPLHGSKPSRCHRVPTRPGQRTGELFIALADQVPARHVHWATPVAMQALGYVLYEARGYLNSGKPADGLRDSVTANLRRADAYMRRVIEHGTFDANVQPAQPAGRGSTLP